MSNIHIEVFYRYTQYRLQYNISLSLTCFLGLMEAVKVISMCEQCSMILIPPLLPSILGLCATSALFLVRSTRVPLDAFALSV